MYTYRAKVLDVVDADTLRLSVDPGFDLSINLTVHLRGLSVPSSSTLEGMAAKAFTLGWLTAHAHGDWVVFKSFKEDREKYGRYSGTVFSVDDGSCLNAELVDSGHATLVSTVVPE